ncbi:NAD(P)-dependent oxidoreductase [Amycolatopsis sp. NPDC089917]|uniref:NAD(P)-dependent oxidoreductase n=1 Tax=Amycolatopsis sp. NPDC089917 TaxID=3155187 RepID=UPI00342A0A59
MLDPLEEDALARLSGRFDVTVRVKPSTAELLSLVRTVSVIVLRSGVQLSDEVFAAAPRLRVVARAGAGVDNIDIAAARRRNVVVFNVPGGSAGAVAELAFGLLLAVMRRITLADRQIRAGVWDKPALVGSELSGKTLGVVGFGNIGSRIGRIAAGFSLRMLTTVERPSAARVAALAADAAVLTDLHTLLRESDAVCVAVPLTEATRGLIGSAELTAMRSTAFLVNVSRSGVVNETALLSALRDGGIAGAGLDVHNEECGNSPFAHLDNVVLTPHIGAMSSDAQRAIGATVVESVTAALAGAPVANRLC